MLGAAPTFHAREGLQSFDASDIFPGDEAEILIARELGYVAEERAFQKDGGGFRRVTVSKESFRMVFVVK